MGLKDFFKREVTEVNTEEVDLHLEGVEEPAEKIVSVAEALTLPTVYSCVDLISNTISNLEIKLYREENGNVEEVKNDFRTVLLNDDTYNLMTGDELKKAMVRDVLLHGACYVYKNGHAKNIKSLHYVPVGHVSILPDELDVIFRDVKIQVQAGTYYTNDFIICTKNTENGVEGIGVVAECNRVLKLALDNMNYTSQTMGNGGVKRGVLQSTRRLTNDAIVELKKAWKRLYSGNNDCIVLNEGITYKELQQTGSEMQMVESKNTIDADICKLFNVPVDMFKNNIPDSVWNAYVKMAITPLLSRIEKALNKSLLGVDEKGKYYFAFDTKQLSKGDIEKRFKAYEIALKNGFMTPSEVRFEEDLNEIKTLNFVKFSLGDVLMNIETGEIYTPNTNTTVDSSNTGKTVNEDVKGGEEDEHGIEK